MLIYWATQRIFSSSQRSLSDISALQSWHATCTWGGGAGQWIQSHSLRDILASLTVLQRLIALEKDRLQPSKASERCLWSECQPPRASDLWGSALEHRRGCPVPHSGCSYYCSQPFPEIREERWLFTEDPRGESRSPPQVMPTLSFSRVRSPGNHTLEGHELIFLNWIMFDSSDFNVYTLGFLIIEKNSVKITCMSYWKPFITEMWTICAERCIILRMLRVSPRELRSLLPLEEGRLRDPFFLVGPVSRKCQSWIQRSVIVTSLAPVVLFLALSCSIRYLIFYFNFNNFIMCIHVCDFTCP